MHHLGILFLILAFCTVSSASAASHGEISYAEHCGDTVPESEATALVVKHFDHISFRNGYFSGGAGLFSQVDTSAVFAPPSVNFRTKSLHKTKKNGTFRIQAAMTLIGASQNRTQRSLRRRRSHRSPHAVVEEATFDDLAGFWSESTGKVCMVGRGVYSDAKGKSLLLSAVLILNFPTVSNLNTSLIDGEVEILNRVGAPSNFSSIKVLAYYAPNPYHFTIFPQATSSCPTVKIDQEDSLEIEPAIACAFLSARVFRIDYKNSADCPEGSCRPLGKSLGFTPRFLSLNRVFCLENGSINFNLYFSNSSSYSYDMPMRPERSLVGEAYWDRQRKQFCLLACRVINADLPEHPHVGACDVGLTLWFPTVMTLKERSGVVGRIWSNKDKKDVEYFDMASIHSLNDGWNRIHGLKYNYTEVDSVRNSCSNGIATSSKSGHQVYPGPKSLGGVRLDINMKDSKGKRTWREANFLSVGDSVFEYDYRRTSDIRSSGAADTSIRNVGFEITNRWNPFDDDDFEINELAAEGVYDSATGRICMKGYRYPKQLGQNDTLDYESIDCEILISIQLAPIDEDDEVRLDGTINSTRIQSQPLYFDTINISSSNNMGGREIDRSVWRMDAELIMVIITLTFSCICIALQIFHVKKQPHILPSVSITMLLVLVLGYTIPLVLNVEALLFTNQTNGSAMLLRRRSRWISANEVIVRMISIVALFLSLRLAQLAWSSRSSAAEDNRKLWVQERRALKWCLPLYAAGALLAWLRSSEWAVLISYSGFVLDGFLLPQIVFNMAQQSKGKVLTPFFYVGIVVTRALPHLYDVYRSRSYVAIHSTNIYGSEEWDFYSTAWDIIIPCEGLLLASIVYLQQRLGGECLVPKRLRMRVYQYEEVTGATI
ncbi:uncharacterized protein LOC122014137 [Zingiber officinale]|uniref:RING-type E3 ubiquitin transferase n=1 Tax=Zingiber officinale TaxID=94328 RepID=A0A8J5FB66_ZINOF|nr:uncharacterized protein LOC122014137 [Zingiber officinale]KAG6484034.1 hypothetical protein ZIOFF_060827 [Zingiber officinale]